ncbi:MAG: NUDIX domain-containing protein, partial [Ilumatobacter sp.]
REVCAEVVARVPIDGDERRSIERFAAEVDRLIAAGVDPFDIDADAVHITGSAIVVGTRGVVLLRHRRLEMWIQPGGHVDPGETPWDAALREAAEETGLPVSFVTGTGEMVGAGEVVPRLVHVDVHAGGRGHTHLDLRYLLAAPDLHPAPPEGESPDVAWFGWPDAIDRADDPRLTSLLQHLRPSG